MLQTSKKQFDTLGNWAYASALTSCIILPGQTMESWVSTLKKAIELDVEIDAYSLHVDPGTMLEKMIKTGKSPPIGDAEFEKQMYLTAYNMLTEAGYKAVGHDRYSRVEWHMRENCLNGWPWGGILTTGAGCFMGYLQRFSYSNIENINEYMKTVALENFQSRDSQNPLTTK